MIALEQNYNSLILAYEKQAQEIESLRQQLADHIKNEAMLRELIARAHDASLDEHHREGRYILMEALAATTDLDGLILCEKNPKAWCQDVKYEMHPEFAFSWVETRLHDFPLFSAWRPKP